MTFVEIGSLPVADIVVRNRLRELDPDTVEVIAATLRAGQPLQHPILCRMRGNAIELVAGRHRLEAHKTAGLEFIPAHVLADDLPEDTYLEMEAVENLARRDLTVLDRASHLGAILKIHEARGYKAGRGGDRKSDQGKSFPLINDLAAKMKVNRRTIRNYIDLYKRLSPKAIAALRGTDLADNYSEIAALAAEDAKHQIDILDLKLSGKSPTIAAAIALHHNKVDVTAPDEKHFAAFVKLWGKSSRKVKRQIRAYLQKEAE